MGQACYLFFFEEGLFLLDAMGIILPHRRPGPRRVPSPRSARREQLFAYPPSPQLTVSTSSWTASPFDRVYFDRPDVVLLISARS